MKSRNFFTVIALAATLLFSACNKTESENPDDNNDPDQMEEVSDYTYDDSTNTYTVNTANGLLAWNKAVQDNLSLNCTLSADIDLTDINYEWLLVGNNNNRYTGTFEGGGHTITGLTVNQEETYVAVCVGLIGCLGSDGKVQNLTLEDVDITGYNRTGGVTACSVSGGVSGYNRVGGVVGRNNGTVTACYWSDYEGNGIGDGSGEATEVDGSDVTWTTAVDSMNSAIDTWNSNNSGSQCDWRYELTGELPTLTK